MAATQKQARVAPRNIQFQDTVQIRQIPRDDEHLQKRPSWDPNLNNHNIFKDKKKSKSQRRVVIRVIIGGAILLAIIIAVIVGVVVSQKATTTQDNSVSYNGICSTGSNQCMSSKGLYCPNGFCACTSPLSWNTITSTCTLLTYNQACSSSSQCNASLQLICTNQICSCNSYYKYSATNNSCVLILNNTLTYGDTCANGSSQCMSSVGLICSNNCSCLPTKTWNGSICTCPSETFLNASNLCQPQYLFNSTCTVGSNQCDSVRGLSCSSSVCVCNTTDYYWDNNYQQCYTRLDYGYACPYDSACKPTLSCPTISGVCNCSQYLPDYSCNCLNNQYYNTVTTQCVSRGTFGGSCTTSLNYTCLISLYCNAGTCACPSGTTWIAANSTCT